MRKTLLLASLFASACLASPASAVTYTYVGSWAVDQGPSWTIDPSAYTGQEAAALLFGGKASGYAISTLGDAVANIDHQAWSSIWGVAGGTKFADNYKVSSSGSYLQYGDTSAYVRDNARGEQYTNYAFSISGGVPEPATWGMMILGLGAIGAQMRRKRVKTAVRFT